MQTQTDLCHQFYIISLNLFKQVNFYYFILQGSHKYIKTQDYASGSDYNGKFTIVFKRLQLQNRSDYGLIFSYTSLFYNFKSGNFHFYVWPQAKTVNSFVLRLFSTDQTRFDWISYFTVGNYLAVSKTFLNRNQIILKDIAYYSLVGCNGLNSFIQCKFDINVALPSINYHIFIHLRHNQGTRNSNLNLVPFVKLQAQIISTTLTIVKFSVEYLNYTVLGFPLIFIQKALFDLNIKRPRMFGCKTYQNPGTMMAIQPFTLNFAHQKYLFQWNVFVGFSHFKGNPFHFQINPITPMDTSLNGNVHGIGNSINLYAITFYGYADDCPIYPMAYACQPCLITYCKQCDVATSFHCAQCKKSFTLASDKQSCVCPSPFTVVEKICGIYPNDCLSSYLLANMTGACSFCDLSKNLVVKNNQCVCRNGYYLDYSGMCQDFCGDGIIFQAQCDDGNNVPNDGCSEYCQFQSGFQCNLSVNPSICKSQIVLRYSIYKIFKKENENVAVFYLKVQNQNNLPFTVLKQNFQPLSSHLTFKIVTSQNPYRQIVIQDLELLSIDQNNQIQLQFPFKFSIQNLNGEVNLNYENTKYKNQTQQLNFILGGVNQGLKFQENISAYKSLGYLMMVGAILNIVGLFIGFFTPKFIGLENILTLQLLYYSQLLIAEVSKWPPGFSFLKYVKFAGGFNQVIEITQIIPLSQISKKMSNLSISKLFIENFNINFLIIVISFMFLIVTVILRNQTGKCVRTVFKTASNQKNNKSDAISLNVKQKMNQTINAYNKMNEIAFWIANQVSIWLILPFLFAISYEFMVHNNEYQIINSSISGYVFLKIRGILSFLSLFMIFCIGCNNFVNFWLSLSSLNALLERPQEIIYKRTLFVYLLVVGCLVLFFNSASVGSAYCSALVLVIQAAYIVVLIRIDPYKQSLHVHTVVLLFNNAVFLVFLIVINLINYVEDLNSLIILGISYFVTGCAGVSIILTFVRLYYELRYGRALQEKIQEYRNRKKQQQRLKKQMLLKKNQWLLQIEAKKKLSEQQSIRDQNIFLLQNQIMQTEQQDLIKWLQNRNLSQKQKQAYYFKQFTFKPLNWMKKHDKQMFLKRKRQLQQGQRIRLQKQQQKRKIPQYTAVVHKIINTSEKTRTKLHPRLKKLEVGINNM